MSRQKKDLRGSDFQEHLDVELNDPEFAAEYLRAAIEANDLEYFKIALGNVAKARGIQNIASISNIPRATLYSILKKNSNPSLTNVQEILRACGLSFGVVSLKSVDAIESIVGPYASAKSQIVEKIWAYIKANSLEHDLFVYGEKDLIAEEKVLRDLTKRTHKLAKGVRQPKKNAKR